MIHTAGGVWSTGKIRSLNDCMYVVMLDTHALMEHGAERDIARPGVTMERPAARATRNRRYLFMIKYRCYGGEFLQNDHTWAEDGRCLAQAKHSV